MVGDPDHAQLCERLIVPPPPMPAEHVHTITSPGEQDTVQLPPLFPRLTTPVPFLVTVSALPSQLPVSVVIASRTRAVHVPVPEPAFSRITFQLPLDWPPPNPELLCVIVVLKLRYPVAIVLTTAAMLLTVELDDPLAELVCGTLLPLR